MKKLLVLVVLISSIKIFSQETVVVKPETNPSNDTVYEKVDKIPEYPGGINAFRTNFSKTFDGSKINAKGMIKSEAQFVISKEGIITDIVIIGANKSMNKEMERSIKAMSKTKWIPAEINGQSVKYKFKLPITMNFE
ncbi:energy transducer TonB [Chryseobacterium gambrini]|uniref:Energy transducer TonB n=1 Tax=Chryseobacterium gambrini TaxID=373672 RepID=A0AAJ1R2A0_9FLAO|nr:MULTISPECIES: energy transducer TonB [Chryseobacterium]MDN4012224.1 energy transducer TonB [Chryseobacterium gambrini]QWA36903.1 hypothetical protein KKI44_13240 [Chryseobacterium sp. ZHDP1]